MVKNKGLGKVGLVLSGGGSHGFAHIGVMKVLSEMNIKPDVIVGCSAGAIIGVMRASGKTVKEIEDYFMHKHPYGFMDPIISKSGFLRGEKMVDKVLEFSKVRLFQDLKIPVIVNAININTGDEKIFSKGLLRSAINASMAFPGVFVPKKILNEYYVDGGVYNPLPIHLLPEVDTAIVVDVSRELRKITDKSSALQIAYQSTFLMQRRLVEYDLLFNKKGTDNNILIRPDVQKYGLFEFDRKHMKEIIDLGENEARKVFKKEITNKK